MDELELSVGFLTYYRVNHRWCGNKFRTTRQSLLDARNKRMTDAEVMAEFNLAWGEWVHALLTGVGVDEARKWFLFWDRVVWREKSFLDSLL